MARLVLKYLRFNFRLILNKIITLKRSLKLWERRLLLRLDNRSIVVSNSFYIRPTYYFCKCSSIRVSSIFWMACRWLAFIWLVAKTTLAIIFSISYSCFWCNFSHSVDDIISHLMWLSLKSIFVKWNFLTAVIKLSLYKSRLGYFIILKIFDFLVIFKRLVRILSLLDAKFGIYRDGWYIRRIIWAVNINFWAVKKVRIGFLSCQARNNFSLNLFIAFKESVFVSLRVWWDTINFEPLSSVWCRQTHFSLVLFLHSFNEILARSLIKHAHSLRSKSEKLLLIFIRYTLSHRL